jgi:hypothetical protein
MSLPLTIKKWRFKLAIAESMINFFKALNFDEHREFFEKIITNFFKDHNYAVREQTIKSIVQSKDVLGYSKYWEITRLHMIDYLYNVL